jgi:hypothetical protein
MKTTAYNANKLPSSKVSLLSATLIFLIIGPSKAKNDVSAMGIKIAQIHRLIFGFWRGKLNKNKKAKKAMNGANEKSNFKNKAAIF